MLKCQFPKSRACVTFINLVGKPKPAPPPKFLRQSPGWGWGTQTTCQAVKHRKIDAFSCYIQVTFIYRKVSKVLVCRGFWNISRTFENEQAVAQNVHLGNVGLEIFHQPGGSVTSKGNG